MTHPHERWTKRGEPADRFALAETIFVVAILIALLLIEVMGV